MSYSTYESAREAITNGAPCDPPGKGRAPGTSIRDLQLGVHANAVQKGFYEGVQVTPAEIATRLMLIVSEAAEALEDVRNACMMTHESRANVGFGEPGKPEGFPTELADIVIRTMDLAEWLGIDLEKEILQKHAYNQTRPRKHGGRVL